MRARHGQCRSIQRALAIDEKALGPDHPGVAIDLNNLAELYNLGSIYREALGVPQDYAEAVRWYHKAAEQGGRRIP